MAEDRKDRRDRKDRKDRKDREDQKDREEPEAHEEPKDREDPEGAEEPKDRKDSESDVDDPDDIEKYATLGERIDDPDEAIEPGPERDMRRLLELFRTRPDHETAYLPAQQVAAMTAELRRPTDWPPGWYPVVDAAVVRSGNRAEPEPLSSVMTTGGPHKFDADMDVLVDDRLFCFPAGTPMTVTHVTKAGAQGVSVPPISLENDGPEVLALTRDGYRGDAVLDEDGIVLPREVSGSDRRDAGECLVLARGQADPHAAVLAGKTVTAAVMADGIERTLESLKPFPVDVLRRATLDTTVTAMRAALRESGLESWTSSGTRESDAVRYLIERIAKGTRPAAPIPLEETVPPDAFRAAALTVENAAEKTPSAEDAAKLKKLAAIKAPAKPVLSAGVMRTDKELKDAAAYWNATEAAGATGGVSRPADLASRAPIESEPALSPPREIVPDDGDDMAGFVVDGDEPMVSTTDNTDAAIVAEAAPEVVLGAEAEVRRVFALVVRTAKMLTEPEASIAKVLLSWKRRVTPGPRLDAAANLLEPTLGADNARLVAIDQMCTELLKAPQTRNEFFMDVAAECVVDCADHSLHLGRPAVTDVSREHADMFSMTREGLAKYVAAVLQDAKVLERGSVPKVVDLAEAAFQRLSPNIDKLLARLDTTRKALPASSGWGSRILDPETARFSEKPKVHAPAFLPSKPEHGLTFGATSKSSLVKVTVPVPEVADAAPKAADLRGLGKLPPYLKSCLSSDNASRRRHAVRSACPEFVAILRVKTLNDSHRAFMQISKSGADVMARIAAAKSEAGGKVNAVGVPSAGDDASKFARFLKTLHDASPGLVRAFDAFCAAVYRRPLSESRALIATDVSQPSGKTGDNENIDVTGPDPEDDAQGPEDLQDLQDLQDQGQEDAPGDVEDDKNIAYDVGPGDSDDETD
jgi:hypothetical protein